MIKVLNRLPDRENKYINTNNNDFKDDNMNYKLIQDAPGVKAGTIIKYNAAAGNYIFTNDAGKSGSYYKNTVENNPEWFEPEFKVGDWVTNNNNKTFKLVDEFSTNLVLLHIQAVDGTYKLATKEEILKVLPFKVGDRVKREHTNLIFEVVATKEDCLQPYISNEIGWVALDKLIEDYWIRFKHKVEKDAEYITLECSKKVVIYKDKIVCENTTFLKDNIVAMYKTLITTGQVCNIMCNSFSIICDMTNKYKIGCVTFKLNELQDVINRMNKL